MNSLDKEIQELEQKTTKLKKLKEQFPDLKQDIDRWSNVRYSSQIVNDKVDKAEIRHTCGCCRDSGVLICPYLDTDSGRIYSVPARFVLGEREPYSYTDRPDDNWEEQLKKNNISQKVIDQVRTHFEYEQSKYNDYYKSSKEEENI